MSTNHHARTWVVTWTGLILFLAAGCTQPQRDPVEAKSAAVVHVPCHCADKSPSPPERTLEPRARRLVDGLKGIISEVEAGGLAPNQAFDRIKPLETVVGPPQMDLPPVLDACSVDADCALTDLSIDLDSGQACCPSLRRTAGTKGWVRALEKTCKSYEPLRGNGRAILLPGCGDFTGPVSATTTRCRTERCLPCMEPNDGSPLICYPPQFK